ncbi:unnamed protein product [Acanthoscelides obtectus]|uniref:Endonuclease/exonuclease/phosphatase domain-containing protein n=1 Tax=Acanthoscelides obtectus TaxID=200917 RepID=A0A9P0LRN5_ACAOB|nr:unnamed protein product [Acanthoscelides obtectus]CAK1634944.1 hypothetical protein AOBTE_LOCUS8971 [Acanthoscelides obtectus]
MSLSDYDIICCTETWLQSAVLSSELFTDKYVVFRADRNFSAMGCSRGGGVLIGIRNQLAASEVNMTFIRDDIPSIDIIGMKLRYKNEVTYFFVIYIPPDKSTSCYERFFEHLESLDYLFGKSIYILGDFNVPEFVNENHLQSSHKQKTIQSFMGFFDLS